MTARKSSWPRCECGKVLCDSPAAALRTAKAQQFLVGETSPFAVYQCRVNPEAWHWSRNGAACPCGRSANSQSWVSRNVARINAKVRGPVQARAYQCQHHGHHWAWYPVDRKFRYCHACDLPAYPDPMAAQAVVDFRQEAHGKPHRIYRCQASRWHIKTGVDPCTGGSPHLGSELFIVHNGVQQGWWTCCGEVVVYDGPLV